MLHVLIYLIRSLKFIPLIRIAYVPVFQSTVQVNFPVNSSAVLDTPFRGNTVYCYAAPRTDHW